LHPDEKSLDSYKKTVALSSLYSLEPFASSLSCTDLPIQKQINREKQETFPLIPDTRQGCPLLLLEYEISPTGSCSQWLPAGGTIWGSEENFRRQI
jgi:hypothetical protein